LTSKACVSCKKLIAEAFAKCTYCGAEQPAVAPPAPKELRCATCKRPYSPKLATCPFCARSASVPPGAAPPTSVVPVPRPAEENPLLGTAVLFGVPLAVGAICGVLQWVTTKRLGGGDLLGLTGPSPLLALLLAPLLGLGFVRRAYGPVGEAIDEVGLPQVAKRVAAVAAIAFVPTALTISGALGWFNGMDAADHEQDLTCTVGSAFHTASSWHITYTCRTGVGAEQVTGSFDQANQLGPEGTLFHLRAAHGRLGYWLRAGDPQTDAKPTE
jgi:hypothetical protein